MNITRDIIHIISRNSNWQEQSIDKKLYTNVYANKQTLTKFLQLLLIGSGLAFTISGIIFFFAFNWACMHKFVKMGIIATLIISCVMLSLFVRTNDTIKKIFLTGAALLVGAFIAVYGQVYQTGADTYEFFMAWTIGVIIWTFVAGFDPLWLLFLVLLHTTLFLFTQQQHWNFTLICIIHFAVNAVFLAINELNYKIGIIQKQISGWLHKIISLTAITAITIAVIFSIFIFIDRGFFVTDVVAYNLLALVLGALALVYCHYYGLRHKSVFYIATVGAAIISIIVSVIFAFVDDEITSALFLSSLAIISGTAFLIFKIIQLNKKWNDYK